MRKTIIKLTEGDLRRIVKESVMRVIFEGKEEEMQKMYDIYGNHSIYPIDGDERDILQNGTLAMMAQHTEDEGDDTLPYFINRARKGYKSIK